MRIPLTLPPPRVKSLYIYWGITILFIIGVEISARYTNGNIVPLILCLLGTVVAGGFSLRQSIFVFQQHVFFKSLEFDEHNLYIRRKNGSETTVPFTDISDIPYDYFGQNSSGNYFGFTRSFLIKYRINGVEGDVSAIVFAANRPQFKEFIKRAQAANPSLQADTWAGV